MRNFFDKKSTLFVLIFLCALCWGGSFVATGMLLKSLDTFEILSVRWTLAVFFFLILATLKLINLEYRGKPIKILLITGILQPVLYAVFEIYGIKYTTASESSIIIAMIPLMALIFGMVFFRAKVSFKAIVAIIIAFVGILISILFSPAFTIGGSKSFGYLFLAGAVIIAGFYNFASSKAGEYYSPFEVTFGMAVMAAIAFNAVNFVNGNGISSFAKSFSEPKLALGTLFLGIMCSSFCYIVYNLSIKKVKPVIASNLVANLTTAIGVILGCLIEGNPFGWYTVLGVVMTMVGIVMASKLES